MRSHRYAPDKALTPESWLQRFIFLETVAGVPGMVAGMVRHTRSLRGLRRDHGWIHTLLEEAENERMHLLTFLTLAQPGYAFRGAVLVTQGVFFNSFLLAYLLHPRLCHRFVGYLEEEAVKTCAPLANPQQGMNGPTPPTPVALSPVGRACGAQVHACPSRHRHAGLRGVCMEGCARAAARRGLLAPSRGRNGARPRRRGAR